MPATRKKPKISRNGRHHGLPIGRVFSRDGEHPYDSIEWTTRDAEIKDESGNVIFRQEGCEVPAAWSQQATNIVVSKYFYGEPGTPARETSVRQLVTRVAGTIAHWGRTDGYFADGSDADRFRDELSALCVGQYGSFNSPVWFNVGLFDLYGVAGDGDGYRWCRESDDAVRVAPGEGYKYPQGSACFIQSVSDDMASIMELARSEAMLFKHGSGTGTDLSTLRSCREKLSGGGRPSGPLSFMRVYDAIAGVVKSGGKNRRAAKMQTLKCHHPDILEFIDCKSIEERKARTLIDAGYEANFNGEAYGTVAFQNANLSVRLSDEFLRAVEDDREWTTKAVTTGEPMETYRAGMLMDRIAEGTWFCGDPGVQYEDTMQRWHTVPGHGPINSTNPCARRGSRLLTDRGWLPVEELAAQGGISVFDGVGFVLGEVWHTGRKPIIRLHTNSGETLDLTADHRVYTADGWIEACECEGRTIPRLLPNIQSTGESTLQRSITGASGRYYNHAGIDLMETLGFIQGDGSFREQTLTVHYTPEKDETFVDNTVLTILQDIAAEKGELDYAASPVKDTNAYIFSRRKLTEWLRMIGFAFVPLPERTLPTVVWTAKRNAQAAFLRGLFGANGNVLKDTRTAVVLVSTCRRMLQEVQLLLRTMGIMAAVRRHSKPQEIEWHNGIYISKESFHLEINHQQDIGSFARLIGFPQDIQRAKLKMIVGDEHAGARDSGFAKRTTMEIVRVEDMGVEDDVYDFRAPTTSIGMCEGIVIHNCSEYVHIDDSACNLASLNLLRFLRDDGMFEVERFRAACRTFLTAQEILVGRASYPTRKIAVNSHNFRPLGLGYANLGSLLMALGLPYDSDAGRSVAAAITGIMQGEAYAHSARMATVKGPFDGFAADRESMLRVVAMHRDAIRGVLTGDCPRYLKDAAVAALTEAVRLGEAHGYRNSQVTVLAPTGTIAFMMDCFTGDTLVAVADGRNAVPIEKLAHDGEDVDVYASDGGRTVVRRMRNVRLVREKATIVRVHLDDGSSVKCTPEHQFMLRDGGYRRADRLSAGDSLMRFDSVVTDETGDPRRKVWMGPDAGGNRCRGNSWKLQYRMSGGRIFEGYDGRSGGLVHHKDGDTLNDSYDNLHLCEDIGEHQRLHWAAKSPEERSRIIKDRLATLTPEQLKERSRKGHEAQSPGQRKLRARKAVESRTIEERQEWTRRGWSGIGDEERSARIKKGWETRRLKAQNHKVVSVVPAGVEDVYCGEVDDVHNFAIVTSGGDNPLTDDLSGIVVHNCDTTGIEPAIALVSYKSLAGRGTLKMVNRTVGRALETLGYGDDERAAIVDHIEANDTIEGSSLRPEHLPVFDCAFPPAGGGRSIHYRGHLRMMAAVQPFISGAISKTCNVPSDATVADIREAYMEGWRLGLKAVAIYRDGSKGHQPVSTRSGEAAAIGDVEAPGPGPVPPRRERLPDTRRGLTHKFSVGGHEGYLNVGFYPDGRPGEVFVTMAKEGSTVGGLMDVLGTSIAIGLQYGVPLGVFVNKFAHSRFEPSGFTPNPNIPIAASIPDYIFRWLGMEFIPGYREANAPRRDDAASGVTQAVSVSTSIRQSDSPPCDNCGTLTIRSGTCFRCPNCGNSLGCS